MIDLTNSEQRLFNQEAEMIRKAQSDVQFFEPLYDRYYECIFRFVFRKTGAEEEEEDLASKVFLKAMSALRKYEIRNVSFGAWLYKIASNEVYKYFRCQKKKTLFLEKNRIESLFPSADEDDHTDKLVRVKIIVAELSELEIQIIELKYFENKNFKEISFILEKKESAVKMKLYRALRKVKEKFLVKSNH